MLVFLDFVRCLVFVVWCCSSYDACCLFSMCFPGRWLMFGVRCLLSVVRHSLFVLCCSLCGVCGVSCSV